MRSDVSLARAGCFWRKCDLIAAEDTRVTVQAAGDPWHLAKAADRPITTIMPRGNGRALLAKLQAGAGGSPWSAMPAPRWSSDPGFKLVRAAIEEGIAVHAVPGPSAV